VKRCKANWGSPLKCRPEKSLIIKSMESYGGAQREDRRFLRRANRQRLRNGVEDLIPYKQGLHFVNHPEW